MDGLTKYLQQFKTPPKPKGGDDSVAKVLDDEFTKLGYGDTARLSILGDVGRENAWNRDTIFKGHADPKNKKFNRGIISWQGDRQAKLEKFLKGQGVYGRNDDDELRGMARFMDEELKKDFPQVYKKLTGARSTYDASEALRQYIKYVPEEPYNTPDPEFRVKNNANWAKRAKNLGLGMRGLTQYLQQFKGDESEAAPTGDLSSYLQQFKDQGSAPSPTFQKPVAPIDVDKAFESPVQTLGGTEYAETAQTEAEAVLRTPGIAQQPSGFPSAPPTEGAEPVVGQPTIRENRTVQPPVIREDRITQPQQQTDTDVVIGEDEGFTATVNPSEGGGDALASIVDQAAGQLARYADVDYDSARKYVQQMNLQGMAGGKYDPTAKLDILSAEETKGRQIGINFGPGDLERVRALDVEEQKAKRRKDTQTATAENQAKQYVESGEVESVAQLLAAKDVGVKQVGGRSIDDLIQEERDAVKRFDDDWLAQSEERQKQSEAYSQLTPTAPQFTDSERQRFLEGRASARKDEIAAAMKEYGSLAKRESEKARIAEEYKTRPLAKPLEFAKGIGSVIPKGVAAILKTSDILDEINPASVQNIAGYFSGKEFKADEGEAHKIGQRIDEALEAYQNKDLKAYYQAGDSIGQVGVQIGLGALTGGLAAPLLYGSSLGASSQYEEAGKLGAGKYTRQAAAVLGGLTAISDALPVAWALKPLRKGAVGNILNGFLNRAYKDAVKEVGEKEAQSFVRELFKRTVDRAKTVATGAALETGQEVFLDKKINDLYASLTYDPTRKVFEISNDDLETAFYAAIGGAGGGAARVAIENRVAPKDNLSILLDKQGNEFEVVEDRGEKVLVKDVKGKISVRNKDRLTPIDEKSKVSKPAAQVDAKPLVPDQPIADTPAVQDAVDENANLLDRFRKIKDRLVDAEKRDFIEKVKAGGISTVEDAEAWEAELARRDDERRQVTSVGDVWVPIKAPTSNEEGGFDWDGTSFEDDALSKKYIDQAITRALERGDTDTGKVRQEVMRAFPLVSDRVLNGVDLVFENRQRKPSAPASGEQKKPAAPITAAEPPTRAVTDFSRPEAKAMVLEAPKNIESVQAGKTRVKELEAEVQEERRRADTNDLTGLGSKNAWKKARPNIEANLEKAIISFDGNNIKSANDTTSHATVDEKVMARIGEVTQKVFEKHGLPIRDAFTPSGDELYAAVPPAMAEQIRDEIEKEFGTVEIVAERDYTNDRTGETFKKGDIVPVTLSGTFGQTVAEAEVGLDERKKASKAANPVRRRSAKQRLAEKAEKPKSPARERFEKKKADRIAEIDVSIENKKLLRDAPGSTPAKKRIYDQTIVKLEAERKTLAPKKVDAQTFPEFLKERIGEHWYVSDRPIKRRDEAGTKRIKHSDYKRLEEEFKSMKSPAPQEAQDGPLKMAADDSLAEGLTEPVGKQRNDWAAKVGAIFTGRTPSGPQVIMDGTPTILRRVGLPAKAIYTTVDVVEKLRGDHGLNRQQVTELFNDLIDPIMVFDSATVTGSKVVVTGQKDHKGDSIIVAILPNGRVTIESPKQTDVSANIVTSAYGKANKALQRWIDADLLLYRNIKKGRERWHGPYRLQLPAGISRRSSPKKTILTQDDFVNTDETLQMAADNFDQSDNYSFKESDYRPAVVEWAKERWGDAIAPNGKPVYQNFVRYFGDSKVVDADGKPLVVYHGTDATSFDTFRPTANQEVQGIFFTPDRTLSDVFAGEIGRTEQVYLKLENPASEQDRDVAISDYEAEHGVQPTPEALTDALIADGFDGYMDTPNLSPQGQAIIAVFRPSQIKSAIGNRGTFDPNEDSILKKAVEPGDREYLTELRKAHTEDLTTNAVSKFTAGNLELNEEGGELLRRIEGSALKQVGSFYGVTYTDKQLVKLADAADEWIGKYKEAGYTEPQLKGLQQLADNLRQQSEATEDFGIAYVFDEAVRHEQRHVLDKRALGGKPPKVDVVDKIVADLGNDPAFKRKYGKKGKTTQAFEIVAAIVNNENYAWTQEQKDFALKTWADGILDLNPNLDIEKFAEIYSNANLTTSDTGRSETQRDDQEDVRRDRGASEGTRDRSEPGPAADGVGTAEEPAQPDTGRTRTEKERKVASFSRILGQEYFYDEQSHGETEVRAAQLISDKGTQAAIHDALYGTPSAEGMRVVYWELERLTGALDNAIAEDNKAEIAAYSEAAADLSAKIVQRQVAGGQETEIAKMLVPLSPESALLAAQKMVEYAKGEGSTLTEDQTKTVIRLAQELKDARADIAKQDKKVKTLEKKIDKLKEERPATKTARMLKQYRKRKPVLIKELQDLFPDASVFNGETYSLQMVAWHGSPHRFEKFDISKIGTGEGAQAYGYGLYFAGSEEVAEHYRKGLSAKSGDLPTITRADGTEIKPLKNSAPYDAAKIIAFSGSTNLNAAIRYAERQRAGADIALLRAIDNALRHLQQWQNDGVAISFQGGAKYRVDLKPAEDEYLLWDKPLAEQSEKVKKALTTLDLFDAVSDAQWMSNTAESAEDTDATGGEFYKDMARLFGNQPEVSDALREQGVRGIKYLDGSSRRKGEGNYNYVIFDDADVDILDSFQMAASGLTDQQYSKLVEYAGGEILENKPYKTLMSELDEFTGAPELSKELHAEAVKSLRSERGSMTEEAKTTLKTRNEHYREADKILKPKGENQNVKPTIDKDFKKLNDQNVRELSQLAQRVWAKTGDPLMTLAVERLNSDPKTINDVIKDIQRANPEMSLSDATKFAREARNMLTETKAEMAEERDKIKGILPEQRKELQAAKVAKQKATMKLNKFLANLADDSNAVKRFNNDMRAKFVSNWGTQAFNAIQSLTVTNPTEAMLDLFTVALKATGLDIGSTPDINAKDILLPASYILGNNRQMAEFALADFPDQFFQVHTGLLGDIDIEPVNLADTKTNIVSKGIHKWFDVNQRVNNFLAKITGAKLQEMHFRNAMVAGTFDQIIRRKSKGAETLTTAIENGTVKDYITEEDAQFAANKAMRVTFAALIDDKPGKFMKRAYDKADSFVPIFLNPVTYARFTYTTTKVMVANPILFGVLDSKKLGGPGYTTRSLASGILGWSGIAAAYGLMANFGGDDDEWYTLKFGDTVFDIRRTFPLSTYFYMAHLIKNFKDGKPTPTGKELLEGFASLETDYFTYGAGVELATGLTDKTKEWSDLGPSGARLAGNFFAGYLRFFKPMRDALAQFDEDENKLRFYNNTGQDKFVQEISKSLPLVAQAYGAETQKDATGQDIGMPFPAGRIVGINVVHPSFLKPEQSTATKWAAKLFRFEGSGGEMSADDRRAWQMRRTIKNAVRRGTPQSAVQGQLQAYRKRFGERSFGRLKDELKMSELAASVKYNFGMTDEKDIKSLRKVWRFATDAEKAELRTILKAKKNRTREFNQEFGLR